MVLRQAGTTRFSCATLGAKLFYHITCAPQYNRVLFTYTNNEGGLKCPVYQFP
nr:MAG TPA: hypothetical protein [Caudoviricetes sp.]